MGGARTSKTTTRGCIALVVLAICATATRLSESLGPSASGSTNSNFAVVAGNGNGSPKPTPTGSAADSTSLNVPSDAVDDGLGNRVISDSADDEVEVLAVSATNPGYALGSGAKWQPGYLYVIAGAGTSPTVPTGSGSSALSTELNSPEGVAIDSEGNILVADTGSDLIAVIAVSATNPGYSVSSWSRGDIYVIAGNGITSPSPTYTGSLSTTVGLNAPAGVAVDTDGNVVVTDTATSEVVVLAVSLNNPGYPIATASTWIDGNIYEVAGGGSTNPSYVGVAADAADLHDPNGIAISPSGDVVFADEYDNEVDLLAISSKDSDFPSIPTWSRGDIYVIAGGGTNEPTLGGVESDMAALDAPTSVSVDEDGNVLIANMHGNQIDILTESSENPGYSLGSDWQQNSVYLLIGGGTSAPSPSSSNALSVALGNPEGVSVGGDGSIVVADTSHGEIEQLDVAPAAPLLTTAGISTNSVELSWSPPVRDGGTPVSGYQVLLLNGSSTSSSIVNESASSDSATISGLASGASYEFEVEALNGVGVGSPSNEVVVTTANAPGTTVTTSPTSSGKPNPDLSPLAAASRRHSELTVFEAQAVASGGYVALVVRCLRPLCAGTAILKGVTRGSRGSEQTFIAGSSHFTVRGKRTEKILVLLTRYSRRVAESGRLIELRGLISVKNGRPLIFSVRTDESPSRAGVLRA